MARRQDVVQPYDDRFARDVEVLSCLRDVLPQRHFQIRLAKRQDVVPMTRRDVGQEEAWLRRLEQPSRRRLKIAGE
jgi:hypothetical protein